MISNMGSIPLLPLFSDTLVWEGYLDSWDHSWWSLLKKIQTQPDQTWKKANFGQNKVKKKPKDL